MDDTERILRPNPGPQTWALRCPVDDLLYGGARGGGKGIYLILDWLRHAAKCGGKARGLILRKYLTDLKDFIAETQKYMPRLGWTWRQQDKQWVGPDGSILNLSYLEREKDAEGQQGWNLCVAKGTPILMSDGSYKAIEQIAVNDCVATLMGPRRVTAVHGGRIAPSVSCEVWHRGLLVGQQVHPIQHPVLSIDGLTSSRTPRTHRRFCQSRRTTSEAGASEALRPDAGRDSRGWSSWSTGAKTSYTESSPNTLVRQTPARLFVPVALHARSVRSAICGSAEEPIQPHSLDKSDGWLSQMQEWRASEWSGRVLRPVPAQSTPGHDDLTWTSDASCDQIGTRTTLGSLYDCQPDSHSCDVHAQATKGTGLGYTPEQACAVSPCQTSLLGESGTTPTHSPWHQLSWEHPYSGEAMRLTEDVVRGVACMTPCGMAEVFDITVDEANHYIGKTGLINKNSYLAMDEAGQHATPYAIDLLRACLRLTGVPEHLLRLTANPGGPGHKWLKERYVDPAPPSVPHSGIITLPGGEKVPFTRVFIPARLRDNPLCDTAEYRKNLFLSAGGRDWLVKAWLEGDWNVQPDGGIFDVDKINFGDPPILVPLGGKPSFGAPLIERIWQGWDTAYTVKTTNDECAGLTVGRDDRARFWLLNLEHGHWNTGMSPLKIMEQQRLWNAMHVLLEGGPAGLAIEPTIQDLRNRSMHSDAPQHFAFDLVSHMTDKVAKNTAFAYAVNQGQVWVAGTRENPPHWWPYLRDQLLVFSGKDGIPDDCVDAGGVAFRELNRILAPSSTEQAKGPDKSALRDDIQARLRAVRPAPPTATGDGVRRMWR